MNLKHTEELYYSAKQANGKPGVILIDGNPTPVLWSATYTPGAWVIDPTALKRIYEGVLVHRTKVDDYTILLDGLNEVTPQGIVFTQQNGIASTTEALIEMAAIPEKI